MEKYEYDGQVLNKYGQIISYKFKAYTMAESEKKARSNFLYQYKKSNGLALHTKIDLPGKIQLAKGDIYG